MKIAVDAMGGDHGPAPVIEGAMQAAQELGVGIILVGKEDELPPPAASSIVMTSALPSSMRRRWSRCMSRRLQWRGKAGFIHLDCDGVSQVRGRRRRGKPWQHRCQYGLVVFVLGLIKGSNARRSPRCSLP